VVVHGDTVDTLQNEEGRPRAGSFASIPIPPAPAPPPRETSEVRVGPGLSVGCARAGEHVFCPDRAGAVHRAKLDGTGDRVVASTRTGARVAAGMLGTHAAVAYLASRKTSEGWVSEAWLAVDDEPPLRISEDGSGATSIAMAEHRGGLVVMAVDARAALTALHVRTITYAGQARLGEDVVVFVGGPGDRRTAGALALSAAVRSPPGASPGPAAPGALGWALLPIAKDVGSFGLASVQLSDPPRVDEPVVWSMYPNGLDPAPIAAATGGGRTWVARVVPQTAEPGAARALELGSLEPDGTFGVRGAVATTGNATDIALAVDGYGAPWVSWVDGGGAWLERFACR
jgi:hypothetical protein